MSETLITPGCDIPDWVYNAIRDKLDNPDSLTKQDITMITNYEPYLEHMQVLAYASPFKWDGAFIIFEKDNGQCREVFSMKTNLIDAVETHYQDIFLTVLEEGSTGFSTYKYYIIKHLPSGYHQVWQGLASHYEYVFNRPFNHDVSSCLTLSFGGELLHSILKRTFRGDDPCKTVHVRKYVNVYRYNENTMSYEFVRRY